MSSLAEKCMQHRKDLFRQLSEESNHLCIACNKGNLKKTEVRYKIEPGTVLVKNVPGYECEVAAK